MDLQLAQTFLTVLATKSFVKASETLHISQSAISLRIQKLEDLVGKELLLRSKVGVEPTVHGEQFEEYARAFVQLWDEAKYQTSLPDGFDGSLALDGRRLARRNPRLGRRFEILGGTARLRSRFISTQPVLGTPS